MDKSTAKRYADHIRQQADQGAAALATADHITGHYWANLSSALDLAEQIQDNDGPLKMYDGSSYHMSDALRGIAEAVAGMRRDLDALRQALEP